MKLIDTNITQELNEDYLIETLNLNNKIILELGCGAASKTIDIASNGFDRKVIACEVDEIQHKKNIQKTYENIEFKLCGAENIDMEDESVDMIFMFKSFHHIPINLMPKALSEIKRVLKPNGLVYISEPLFTGDLSDIIALFHNEEQVRVEAFNAIKSSVEKEEFKLFQEIFFYSPVTYNDFEEFQSKIMNVTFNDNKISKELEKEVEKKFNKYIQNNNPVTFKKPFRVDILQKI
ncbi:MAG: SAM-dependent methyltransferase [Arcobacter sp.]|uniref:class I SAM-dependent methyltransferase n=1 Tax=uncultured Arcobacter sp. TaxID=165434 RepID=UPI000CC76853|nr:class I SAM-dependent methyltransferase [uncultured Arcobacter sp.]PLY11489.1 MAG: SAM-dependent methyltransferase [Arcobacter sp.]